VTPPIGAPARPDARGLTLLRTYCAASAVFAVGLAFAVLCGWALNIRVLKSVLPGLVTMKPNAALCFAALGISLGLLLPRDSRGLRAFAARTLAAAAALIGAATLAEYLTGVNLKIDNVMFVEPLGSAGTSSPGRMAPTAAAAFVALGVALLLLDWKTRRGRWPAQVFSLFAGLIALMAVNGYIYRATAVDRLILYTQVAAHTAVALLLLSGAVFFARPRSGLASDLTSPFSGSVMARRFLPAVFVIPVLLGWLCLQGQRAGLYGTEPGLALYATSTMIAFAVLVWMSARGMNTEHIGRGHAEVGLLELNAELEERVGDRTTMLEQQAASLIEQAALLDLAQDAVVVRDMNRRILYWNRGAETLFGWSSGEALGKDSIELLQSEFPEPVAALEAHLLREGQWEGEASHRTRGGARLTVESRWALQRDAQGVPVRILATSNDVTARRAAETLLGLEAERLSLATAVARLGVWEWDVTSGALTWDATMFDIYGLPGETHLVYETWSSAVHPDDLPRVEATLQRVIAEKGRGGADFRILLPDGSQRNVAAAERAVLDEHGNVLRLIGVNMDITERAKSEEALRHSEARMAHSAQHDYLTGLPNRMLLNDRIRQAIAMAPRHEKQVAILFLDLDGFKHINDSLGHPVGDQLLQSIASRLVNCVRNSDTVSRQGGDEFVVLLSEVEQVEDAAITARRMLQEMAHPHSIGQNELHVTASIGVSVYPDDGLDADTLIKNADTAMYQAKENGRQGYQFFKPAMNVRAVERQSIEEGLRRALERHELALHYQPKVDLRTGAITGAEALLRWTHPTRGLVSPAQFIPVAEDCGLILPIGNWVLREACRQARLWVEAGLRLPSIAVNISAMEFRSKVFLGGIFEAIESSGLDPRMLELELTESVLMKHAEAATVILESLRAKGVQVAVDDFGTGYSSLSYLRRFQVDSLKIDQSFVRQITTAPDETSIVTAIISMGRNLGLRVVAEGVETRHELAFLRTHDCDEAQGYLFSRPVPPEQFAKLLKRTFSGGVLFPARDSESAATGVFKAVTIPEAPADPEI
jgi:diguanylate cyclase (GGDEF)-like protein/PAS domain S-box-containing protein